MTYSIAILVGALAAVAGFLLALVWQGRKASRLQAKLDWAEAQAAQVQKYKDAVHQKDLAEQAVQAELAVAKAEQERLAKNHTNLEARLAELDNQLETRREQLHTAENALTQVRSEKNGLAERTEDLSQRLGQSEQECKSLLSQHQTLASKHAKLETQLKEQEQHFAERLQQLQDTKKALTVEFENLANKIFEEKGQTFSKTSQTSIEAMLKPFREQIDGFQKRVNEINKSSVEGHTRLSSEIEQVLKIGLQMSEEANNLTLALKGDSQQRGAWGEAQLERTLEMCGLLKDTHYEAQTSFKDNEGRVKRTDYLIKLPRDKQIIIDSKVTLNAYDRLAGAQTPEEYNVALAEHIQAVKQHIKDLSSKDYTSLIGVHSPDFVLMFMPVEPAYIEVLKNQKDLFEYGYSRGVVLVSHTTLIPILRTVSNLWKMEQSHSEVHAISQKAGDIYNQVRIIAERLQKLGNSLKATGNHYNSTVKALAGQQGLYGKVERFNRLSNKVSQTIQAPDMQHIDIESERLELIAEPLESSDPQVQQLPKTGDNA